MKNQLPSTSVQAQAAKIATKKSKASRLFNKKRRYDSTLIQRVTLHTNGNPNEPLRKAELFWDQNSAEEMCEFGLLSESALLLESIDGRPHNVAHLISLSRAGSMPKFKVNNVSNLVVILRETNQIINKRCISRSNAEVLDRMILAGNYLAARIFAEAVCY